MEDQIILILIFDHVHFVGCLKLLWMLVKDCSQRISMIVERCARKHICMSSNPIGKRVDLEGMCINVTITTQKH